MTGPECDYLFPDTAPTIQVKIRCACGPVPRTIPLHMTVEGVSFFRRIEAPPDLVVQSWKCPNCKQKVKITARMLYLAA
jgi:hypothetical protein